MNTIDSDTLSILRCPDCKTGEITLETDSDLSCSNCKRNFSFRDNIISMLPVDTDTRISDFWSADLKRRFKDISISEESFNEMFASMEKVLENKGHLLAKEIDLKELSGKKVLEIGSGSGTHAALMKKYGAHITAMDISKDRVEAAAVKFEYVPQGTGTGMQGDSVSLPFQDNTFDVVYSNGVLHHSKSTRDSVEEVYRVLKPGGKALIMLYAKRSASTYLYRYPKGIMSGLFWKYPTEQWMGYVTEGGPVGDIANPYTRVYTHEELKSIFSRFATVSIRQSSFRFHDVPLIGNHIYNLLAKMQGAEKFAGGMLTSGERIKEMLPIEKYLSKYIGNCLNVLAVKQEETE